MWTSFNVNLHFNEAQRASKQTPDCNHRIPNLQIVGSNVIQSKTEYLSDLGRLTSFILSFQCIGAQEYKIDFVKKKIIAIYIHTIIFNLNHNRRQEDTSLNNTRLQTFEIFLPNLLKSGFTLKIQSIIG